MISLLKKRQRKKENIGFSQSWEDVKDVYDYRRESCRIIFYYFHFTDSLLAVKGKPPIPAFKPTLNSWQDVKDKDTEFIRSYSGCQSLLVQWP